MYAHGSNADRAVPDACGSGLKTYRTKPEVDAPQLLSAAQYRASSRQSRTEKKPGNKRKQGGQKGRKRHLRELIPFVDCPDVIPCKPTACRRCGGELQQDSSEPLRHQGGELPEIQPTVCEYQLFRGHCPSCGITTAAELPEGVPSGQEAESGLHLPKSLDRMVIPRCLFLGQLDPVA